MALLHVYAVFATLLISFHNVHGLTQASGTLSNWSSWSSCSVTCGNGIIRRWRQCENGGDVDVTCTGSLSEEDGCTTKACSTADPVDGQWTYWSTWSVCNLQCGGGLQTRQRHCTNPAPDLGGRPCSGNGTQTKPCAPWPCPDCSRSCLPGSQLSSNCNFCQCPSDVLTGTVTDWQSRPVGGVRVYLLSLLSAPVATTDDWGSYAVSGVCITNDQLVFKKDGFLNTTISPSLIKGTTWKGSATLQTTIAPFIRIHPQSKVRLVGQSVTFCCEATGNPVPDTFTWFKDDQVIPHQGPSGFLVFSSLQTTDRGVYKCIAESEAGTTMSEEAFLTVQANTGQDTCGAPTPNLMELPKGCKHGANSSFLDVRTCGNRQCTTSSLRDNGTCSDWWPRYCCDADHSESVEIVCNGFTYNVSRVTSCVCRECEFKTTISGRAFGWENGTGVPLQLGSLYVNGVKNTMTDMMGDFDIRVPAGMKKVIVTFKDEIFRKFIPVTKIFDVVEGSRTTFTVNLPIKPAAISFNTYVGLDISLGDTPSGVALSIPGDAILKGDGTPYTGTANATVYYIDPRRRGDIEAANGDFFAEEQDGSRSPLETYGMLHLSVEDMAGKTLKVHKPVTITLDPSVFNISLDKNGEPDVSLWNYDVNKGVWVEIEQMHFQSKGAGRRRLLTQVVVGSFKQIDVPQIQLLENKTLHKEVVIGYHWVNIDKKGKEKFVPIKVNRTLHILQAKRNACFVSASVYEDFSMTKTKPGVNVVAVTQERNGLRLMGSEKKTTNQDGHVCLGVFCEAKVYLYAEGTHGRLYAVPGQDLPPSPVFPFSITKGLKEIEFTATNIQDFVTANGTVRYSPVVDYDEKRTRCEAEHDRNFKFQFAPFTKPPLLFTKVPSSNVYNNKYSWYPMEPNKPTRRSCYIKALITTNDRSTRVVATSYQVSPTSGGDYGTYDVGPLPKTGSSDLKTLGACIEFRCAGLVQDGKKVLYNVSTLVNAHVTPAQTCRFRPLKSGIQTSSINGGNGFQFLAEPYRNYGPKFGVYINDVDREKVREFCYTGRDTGNVGRNMDPRANAAVELNCT